MNINKTRNREAYFFFFKKKFESLSSLDGAAFVSCLWSGTHASFWVSDLSEK